MSVIAISLTCMMCYKINKLISLIMMLDLDKMQNKPGREAGALDTNFCEIVLFLCNKCEFIGQLESFTMEL